MKILNDPTEQQFIESNKLPFKGSIPVFGTSYGIGERIRGIVEDYTKGFGLGPHGHSPSSDKYHWDSFSNEARRTDTLTLENVLVRLFNEKLAAGQSSKDEYQWGLEMVSWMSQNGQEMNVQSLLLSLREWREAGRKPSLLLSRVLKVYLKDEIALFNESLPAGVPRLTIANTYRHEDHNNYSSDGRLWEETDPLQYKLNYYKASSQNRLHSEEPYLQTLILEAQQKNLTSTSDNAYQNYVSQTLIQQFSLDVAALVGKDIPTNVVEARTQANNGSHARNGGNVAQLVRVSHLAHLLEKYGVTTQSIFFVLRGLAECPEQQALEQHNNKEMGKFKIANDFAVPVSLILTWTGPQGTNTGSNARKNRNQNNNNTSNTNNIMATLRKDASAKGNTNNNNNNNTNNVRDKVVFHVLEELALSQDGTATDILYAMRQNKKNATLKQEFITAFMPAFNHDLAKTTHTYQEYMEGRYVPNINVAFEVFADFLKKAATEMKFENSPFLQTYFEVDYHPYHVNLLSHAKLKLLPLTEGPFHYENSLVEQVETVDRFNQYHITAGLTQVPMTGFIISDSKSMNYFLNRKNDVAHVTQTNDHHLLQFIQQQSFYKEFMTNRKNDTTHPLHYLFFTLQQGAGIISSFHRYFYRVAPMLSFYENVLNTYGDNNQNNNNVNLNKNNALRQILNADKNTSMELEFRRNAERYWRGVMDGKNMEENILPTRNNNNNNNGFNPRQHGRNNNNHKIIIKNRRI
ncbi:hypothetical protein AGDE_10569 [Angomonas deanei]|uniref:Uncharacterized protein n=1 Tax=Angomonas deanei TaxID=59799 RepID=A0A7G2CHZ0_9TRYP|nr:hypothetical protein AGDE_10569 [Angomonas deanei]CAD2219468.1 hypothetical protein, conserved [Angomonas deanei]|eukprot:EPY28063.1 hypothetical protein AGDE_10569 [Angomonas deanei]